MSLFHTAPIRAIAWDFDGVLNDNETRAGFRWQAGFEERFGAPVTTLQEALFTGGAFDDCLTGKADVLDRLGAWTAAHAPGHAPSEVLEFWLGQDFHPAPALKALVAHAARRGLPQVIASNADTRRADWIEGHLAHFPGIGGLVASSRVGARKPDPAFFAALAEALDLPPAAILFVDDLAANVNAASGLGFRTYRYSFLALDNLRRLLNA